MQSYSAEKAVSITTDPSQRLFHTAPVSMKDRPIFILATVCVQSAYLCLAEAPRSKYFPSVVALVAPCCGIRPHVFDTWVGRGVWKKTKTAGGRRKQQWQGQKYTSPKKGSNWTQVHDHEPGTGLRRPHFVVWPKHRTKYITNALVDAINCRKSRTETHVTSYDSCMLPRGSQRVT